jgi:hypothetical protein
LRELLDRRAVRVVGVVVLFVVVVVLLFLVLDWYVGPRKPSVRKDLVLAVAQILGGTALLAGLYFTWRTLQVNREGQITERYTRAIEQLGATYDDGSKNLVLRLGGIHALERIAKESKEDYWPILEVLTAYVREYASSRTTEGPTPDLDIQAVMTVLRRRTHSFSYGEPEPLDLSETHLSGVYLWRANLRGAHFRGANLSGANLWGANLSYTNLMGADLSGADLSEAVLRGADLSRADLRGAHVTKGQLEEASRYKHTQFPSGRKPDEQSEGG